MSKFKDKNLLFYRKHDKISMNFIQELNKNIPLRRQFITIDMDDKKINVPPKIAEIPIMPILVVSGNDSYITGENALVWMMNNSFAEKGNGIEYMSLSKGSSMGAFIDDKKLTDMGGSTFAPISGGNEEIGTFKEREDRIGAGTGTRTSVKEREFNSKLKMFQDERNKDFVKDRPTMFTDRTMPRASR